MLFLFLVRYNSSIYTKLYFCTRLCFIKGLQEESSIKGNVANYRRGIHGLHALTWLTINAVLMGYTPTMVAPELSS